MSTHPQLIGARLGAYDIQALLGSGGMANVYRGFDINTLAEKARFEEVAYLLLYGKLPNQMELDACLKRLIGLRCLPAPLKAVLEQGFDASGPVQALLPSAGFSYSYDMTQPVGSRVTGMTLDGKPVDPAASYRITTNNFLAQGGDSFTLFARQRDAVAGGVDLDALQAWLQASELRAVPSAERAIKIGG